jgi:hypothetical protein
MSADKSTVVVKWMDAKIYPGMYSTENALE